MARLARVVVSDVPHHVTQRGNRRQPTFFCDDDYEAYLDLVAEWTRRHGVAVCEIGTVSPELPTAYAISTVWRWGERRNLPPRRGRSELRSVSVMCLAPHSL